MQGPSDLAALQARLSRFRDERDWARFHSPGNLAKAISVEAAELLELFLWVAGEEEAEVSSSRRSEVEAELADVLIQCLNFADAAGIDVLAAVDRKIEVNEQRYPVEKARGNSRKHTDL
jgi:NTP pyrophosphatase (non-canonical NTP hydrolase)